MVLGIIDYNCSPDSFFLLFCPIIGSLLIVLINACLTGIKKPVKDRQIGEHHRLGLLTDELLAFVLVIGFNSWVHDGFPKWWEKGDHKHGGIAKRELRAVFMVS